MAVFTHGKNATFWITDSGATSRNISSVLTEVQLPVTADAAEVTALGDSAKNNIAGLKDSTIALTGNRDVTIDGYLFGLIGTTCTYIFSPEGSASGKVQYSGTLVPTGYSSTSNLSGATNFTFGAQGAGPVTRTVL